MKRKSTLDQITPVLLSYNEVPNIGRTLAKLDWAREILIVDSGSTDGTVELVGQFSNVRCVTNNFSSHAEQWNFAISEPDLCSDWVLALDADYVLSDEVISEIADLDLNDHSAGYRAQFRYCVFGRPLRGSLYPPVVCLYRRSDATYEQDGHTQRVRLDGPIKDLRNVILHDDRKSFSRWLWAQERYAELEANALLLKRKKDLNIRDRLRLMIVVAPWLVPLHCFTVKQGFLDGWTGVFYALQRGIAEAILSLSLLNIRLSKSKRED